MAHLSPNMSAESQMSQEFSDSITFPAQSQAIRERQSRQRSQSRLFEQLGSILLEFYLCEGPVFILDAVVELFQANFNLVTLCDTRSIPVALAYRGDASFAIYELDDDLPALDSSIKIYQRLLSPSLDSTAPFKRVHYEATLAYAFFRRFRATNNNGDCQSALQILDTLTQRSDLDLDDFTQAWIMTVAGLVKTAPATQTCVPARTYQDLLRVLDDLRNSRRLLMPRSLYILSVVAESELAISIFYQTHQVDIIQRVIPTTQSALQLCSGTADVLRSQVLRSLFLLHRCTRHTSQDPAEITALMDKMVELATETRSLTGLMTRNRFEQWHSLYKLSIPTVDRAVYSGDLGAMEQAMHGAREVVVTCPDRESWEMSYAHSVGYLVFIMGRYFDATGRIGVLDELFSIVEHFVSPEVLKNAFVAGNIAEAMLSRAQVADISVAKSLVNKAIQVCQARKASADLGTVNNEESISINLQLIAASRMQIRLGDLPLIRSKNILSLTQPSSGIFIPQDTSDRVGLVLAQTDALMIQARTESDVSLLVSGISLIEEVLALSEISSSIYLPDLLGACADIFVTQSDLEPQDTERLLTKAWDLYRRAITAVSGRPRQRFQICLRWANRAVERGNTSTAFDAYSHCIDILPHVVSLSEEVIGRIEALRQVNGLAALSVATALTIRDIPMAIDFLERTRGILWLQSFRAREAHLSILPSTLRQRFVGVTRELEDADRLAWTTRRHKAEELQNILLDMRMFPGLERFQLPPLLQDVQLALEAERGFVVVIVPIMSYCDVVILGMNRTRLDACHLRLTTLTAERIRHLSRSFSTTCSITRAAHHVSRKVSPIPASQQSPLDPTNDLLSELWTSLVKPILEHMNIYSTRKPNPGSRKRLWWCPVGALSSLPIHAAGIYEESSQEHVGDYAVSSYTPTISALHRLLTDKPGDITISTASLKMLLVSQPTTAGLPTLVMVESEIEQIKALLPPKYTVKLNGELGVSVRDVLEDLNSAQLVHLACHGHQDQTNPLNSGFELKDGRLTLGQLMRLNMPHAQMAYLSACDSAGMDESRPDEGLNLVGTMIFAGFRSVIGTMWTMDDLDGPFMAKCIYSQIFKDGVLDLRAIPYAVNDAVRQLRESGVPASRWATYVHFGV